MLAHGQSGLAAANNERIYFFNWQIPVHSWLSKVLSRHGGSRYSEPVALDGSRRRFPR
jgi:hypothetical protein